MDGAGVADDLLGYRRRSSGSGHADGHDPLSPPDADVSQSRSPGGIRPEWHLIDPSGGAFEAFRQACSHTWGCAPVEAGSGGSLPLVAALAETFPRAELRLTGVADPESRAHGENASVHLAELMNCCVTEAVLLGNLARM